MTLHQYRKSTLPANMDFVANPVLFTSNSTATVNISATSYGAALNNSGLSLWNHGALPLNSVNTILAGQNITIPFINTNLPNFYFDAIILLTVDGAIRLPYGFSTSPDNTIATSIADNKNLYWADLWCGGLNNNPGFSTTNNNYMFGGTGLQYGVSRNYKINFSEALTAPLTFNWQIQYVSYTLGINTFTLSGSTTAAIGALNHTFYSGDIINDFFTGSGQYVYFTAGYFKVQFNISNPGFKSLLPVYHWGLA